MSRHQPPPQRDRSPPRLSERRTSTGYNGPPGPRTGDNVGQAPPDRAPPRGPKAQYDGPPRGRGNFRGSFGGRPEYRDRERDLRSPILPDRRDDGRPDWQRRDRDFNSGDRGGFAPRGGRVYTGRDRSASPTRTRRGSSEAISTHSSRHEAPSNFYGPGARGGYPTRGGRGDWDRNRGRGSFVSEREREFMPPRSRSREDFTARERDRGRDFDPDRKDRSDRRETDTNRDRDLKPRDHDLWQRDRSTGRQSSGSGPNSVGISTQNRNDQNGAASPFDPSRRRSAAFTPGPNRDWRRDNDAPEYFGRAELPRDAPSSRKLSPTPAPPSAAASALDYGPPPAAKVTETPADVPPPHRDSLLKTEPPLAPSFLPPTGPKAERPTGPLNQGPAIKPLGNDQWVKSEPQPRALRPAPKAPRAAEPARAPESRDLSDLDRPSQISVPSGPRASLIASKPRMLPHQGLPPSSIPAGPSSASKATPVDYRPQIPTGPRSERDGPKSRPGAAWSTGNATWTSPEYKPRPSIMNNLQSKPPFDGREIHRNPLGAFNQPQKLRFQPPIIPRSRPADQMKNDESLTRVMVTDDHGRTVKPEEETDSAVDVDMSLNPSSDDEIEDDGLDEGDYEQSEETFKKQMRQLEALKPASPLEDPLVVELLFMIQFLGLIAEGIPLRNLEQSLSAPGFENEQGVPGLPSPELQSGEQIHEPVPRRDLGRPLSKLPVNPIPTPPLEDLPFFQQSSPQFEVFDDSDDEVQHEAIITAMRTTFEQAAWQQVEEVEELHGFYKRQYPEWRRKVAELDRRKLDAKQPSPRPATPVPPMPMIIAQPSTTERPSRASMRNATEYDLEKVMEESKLMEQERRDALEREAGELEASGARPDYNQEAVVPDMIDPSEQDLSAFRDENWLVPHELALDIFGYVPPVDDFTKEEQILFVEAFVAQPKRWGRIASSVPGRDYKQCIMHYYLTKNQAVYKSLVRQLQPRKRRGRVANSNKTRIHALGDSTPSYDGNSTAVTDSGRPRRAAAPTFGEAGTDSEALTPAPIGGKRGARSTDPAGQSGEKPARTKKVGTGATKQRRAKKVIADSQLPAPQILQDISATTGSPQKGVAPTPRPNGATSKELSVMVESPQISDIRHSIEQDIGQAPPFQEMERSTGTTVSSGASTTALVTSYWSVPEQQKFPKLIAYFGRDFGAIADFMKTKSSTMIKNHYTRLLSDGKRELEDAAKRAEGMRERGEAMGPPPTPVAPAKRRYESTTSAASLSRPMINLEMATSDSIQGALATVSTMIDEFPANTIQRSARGDLSVKPRPSREIPGPGLYQPGLQQRVLEVNQPIRTPMLEPKQATGPRPGFFPQERQELRPSSQGLRNSTHEQPATAPVGHQSQDYAHQFEQMQQRQPVALQQQSNRQMPDTHTRPQAQPDVGRHAFYQTEPLAPTPQARETLGHNRRDSGGIGSAPLRERWERESDPASFRREPPHRGLQYGHASTQQTQPGFSAMSEARKDVPRPASTPLITPPEPPKQAPSKRSNIFSLLDDGPSEPAPPKRASVEGAYSQSAHSPSLSALAHDTIRQRPPPRSTTPLASHGSRSHFLQTANSRQVQTPAPDFTTSFGGSPAPGSSRDNWILRFDPRLQQSAPEHSPVQVQPPIAQYSSASSQSGGLSRLPMDQPARLEPSHRSNLGQLHHPGHAPSPPPQTAMRVSAPIPPFRSASGSSQQTHQHSRVTSLGYPQTQTQQLPGQSGSTGSTPVSALHQSRGSLSGYNEPRFAQQREQQVREQQLREHQVRGQLTREQVREQEARQREYDMQQQQQHTYMQARQQLRAQDMEQDRYRYPGVPPPRNFTSPNGQFSTTPQQQQPPPPPQQSQQPSHYRQFSQGGGEERR